MKVFVKKADGSKQLFDRYKVIRTCVRMGASLELAQTVADKVESRIREGTSTKHILKLIFTFMREHRPEMEHLLDLRTGLSLMASKPEFEMFVRELLMHHGFEVSSNQIMRGHCGEHEVDAIAKRDGVTYFVEAKHHVNYHSLTGLDESRIAYAVLDDVLEGAQMNENDFKIDKAMIVTNTRYSEHALVYGRCKGIVQIGWNYPKNRGLERLIEEKKLYPLSCLRGLGIADRLKLVNSGIVLINQLLGENPITLARKTRLSRERVEEILVKAQSSINLLGHP